MDVARDIHRVSQGIVNFYAVEEAGAFTIVDAGTPADWDALLAELSSRGAGLPDVRAVLLTHAHADHTGFAERARKEAGAAVWVHGADVEVAKGGKLGKNEGSMFRYLGHGAFWRTVVSLTRRGGAKIVPILEVSAFADGETIDVPGRPRAIHAPGHTPGMSAILVESSRALMTGDALVTWNPFTGRLGPQIMPAALNQDSGQALASLSAFESLPADVVLPGHGEPWSDGAAAAVKAARAAGRS